MTYCVAITVNRGLVFVSDSRTNAGVDQISTFSKMHTLVADGERMITLLSAGNLATSQAVVRQLRRDLESGATRSLKTVQHLAEAAEYVGELSLERRQKHRIATESKFDPEASFIVGGQIGGREPQIFLVYPEGNHIRASAETPYLQIGEVKYGKPILDRIIRADLPLEDVARCGLVSMDSTARSNVTVGPPVDLLIYARDSLREGSRLLLTEDDEYLYELRKAWQLGLQKAFENLPRLPASATPNVVRLADR
ncbi:MAG: peptidase [Gammaproteobacteria bacterium]